MCKLISMAESTYWWEKKLPFRQAIEENFVEENAYYLKRNTWPFLFCSIHLQCHSMKITI